MQLEELQHALKLRGHYQDKVDGIYGPNTRNAIIEFKLSQGLPGTPRLSQITLRRLLHPETKKTPATVETPWLHEIGANLGLHEVHHNAELRRWLKSDGRTLGDPARFPWCGDAVQTAIANTLPNEKLTGRVDENPYLARNWLEFGEETEPVLGCVVVFWRGRKDGISGHVGVLIGRTEDGSLLYVRGGNQRNSVSDAWLDADRLLGCRYPKTEGRSKRPVPIYDNSRKAISTNEA